MQVAQSTQVSRLQLARKLFLVASIGYEAGILRALYSTVPMLESTSLLPILFRHAAFNYSVLQQQKRKFAILLCHSTVHISAYQLHCLEFSVPRTNSSIKKQLRSHITYPTELDQLYSRAFALRSNRALHVLASFKMVVGEKNAFAPVVCINDLIRVQDPQLR